MEIYEKIRYYREHTDYSQRNVAKILCVSRNTVKKYWEGQTVPWERKPGSGRKNDSITGSQILLNKMHRDRQESTTETEPYGS